MKKTLLEHHYETRIESLTNDEDRNYGKRIVVIEMLASRFGWKYLIEKEAIDNKAIDIYRA